MKTGKTIEMTAALAAVLAGVVGLNAAAAPPSAPERSYSGQVVSVNPQEHTVRVKAWLLSNKQFNLGDKCTYVMVDNNRASAADLRPGQDITVRYQVSQGVRVADRIEQHPMRYEGVVTAINPDTHSLTLHQRGLDRTLQIADGCTVVLKDDKSGKLGDIQTGDHVTVTYETPYELPVAREISQASVSFTGKLAAVDLDDRTVKAKDTFSTMKFVVGDNCTIVINGKTNGKLTELRPNERLTFNYEPLNGVNIVNRIAPAPESVQTDSKLTTTPAYPGYPIGY